MMVGLYGESEESAYKTAEQLIACRPDTVRIYPTVVLPNTRLAELLQQGEYHPFSLEKAVDICADLLGMFEDNHIRVIRLGLMPRMKCNKNGWWDISSCFPRIV